MSLIEPSPRRSINSGSWLVTFGDLLTLMLCLFVTIVSQSPLNPATEQAQNGVSPRSAEQSAKYSRSIVDFQSPGTTLAPSNDVEGVAELTFLESDFSGEAGELVEASQKAVKNEVIRAGYDVSAAAISTCSLDQGASEDAKWLSSVSRSFSLRRQLVDAGIDPSRISVSVRGPWCKVATASATVTIEFKKQAHG